MNNNPNLMNQQFPPDLAGIEFSNPSESDIEPPFEFSIFERVETGFDNSHREPLSSKEPSKKSVASSQKFTGPKEVIFVSGWIDIGSIYRNYQETFYIRIIVGFVLLFCILRNNQNFLPLLICAGAISSAYVVKNLILLLANRKSHTRIKLIRWVELQLSIGLLIVFAGFALVYCGVLPVLYLPLFTMPYLVVTFAIFMFRSDDNAYLAQKNFCLIEAIQFLLVALKLVDPQIMNWNFTLFMFMTCAIYMTTLGLLLMVILSCSFFGFLYQNLEQWKLKSLIWMTSYYIFTGINFVYIVKGLIEYYDDDNVITREQVHNYIYFVSNDAEILTTAGMMLIVFNFLFLCMHVLWKREIKKYLSRIIFKKDIRKEVSLRKFKDSFAFKVIQCSTTFFRRNEPVQKDKSSMSKKLQGEEDCIVCFSATPGIMQEPCGHGGICKDCCLEYLKDEQKCMICRERVKNILLIEQDPKDLNFYAVGQVKLNH